MNLDILTEMSNRYGKDKDYILAGGGNTSVKLDNIMYVKGSGCSLANVTPEGFIGVDVEKLRAMLEKPYPDNDDAREALALQDMMAAKLDQADEKRPSVECILHAIFPYKYVLHLHPAIINGISCSNEGKKACKEVLGDEVAWAGRAKPGYILSKTCYDAFNTYKAEKGKYPQVAMLQNHGIFVAAETVQEIDALLADVVAKIKAKIKEQPDFTPIKAPAQAEEYMATLKQLYADAVGSDAFAVFCTNQQVIAFAKDKEAMQPLSMPYSPDHIVYCKGSPLYIQTGEDIGTAFKGFIENHGYAPVIVLMQDVGFIALGKDEKSAENAKLLFLDAMKIAVYARSFGGSALLDKEFAHFMIYWEFESYRLKAEK